MDISSPIWLAIGGLLFILAIGMTLYMMLVSNVELIEVEVKADE